MPIDLNGLSQDAELRHRYKHSLRLRSLSKSNDDDDDEHHHQLFSDVLDLRVKAVETKKERDYIASESRKRGRSKQLPPRQGGEYDAWAATTKARLEQLTQQHTQLTEKLEQAWNRLPNFVDTELTASINQAPEDSPDRPDGKGHAGATPINGITLCSNRDNLKSDATRLTGDLFFELGGYQEFGDSCVLTGVGMNLLSALDLWIQHMFTRKLKLAFDAPISQWELPSCMIMDSLEIQAMLGTPDKQNLTSYAPSWLLLLQQEHGGKTYFDRHLPIFHLLACSGSSDPTASLQPAADTIEAARRSSWRSTARKKKMPIPWYHRLATPQRCWQILTLTGPCLAADSRPLQQKLVQLLVDLFSQLVPHGNVRARVLRPPELLLFETSCVVVEGSFPTLDAQQPSARTVCLGYVSNLLDYASSTNIRHGSTKEGLHIVYGTICSVPETLEWILRHGRVSNESSTTTTTTTTTTNQHVSLPDCLFESDPSMQLPVHNLLSPRMPLICRVVIKKNGKRMVQEMGAAPKDRETQDKNKTNHQSAPSANRAPITESTKKNPSSTPATTRTALTPDEIRLEALSSQFDFLPFYYR